MADILDRGADSRRMVAEAQRMIDRPYGMLTLWGGSGNGKTLVLQVLVNAFIARGQMAIYTTLTDMLNYVREGYDPEEELKANIRYKKLLWCKLLCVDEVDKAKITEKAYEILTALIDDRYRYARETGELQRHTALAMNEDPEFKLPTHIYSRLRHDLDGPEGFRIIENRDPDARPAGL